MLSPQETVYCEATSPKLIAISQGLMFGDDLATSQSSGAAGGPAAPTIVREPGVPQS